MVRKRKGEDKDGAFILYFIFIYFLSFLELQSDIFQSKFFAMK